MVINNLKSKQTSNDGKKNVNKQFKCAKTKKEVVKLKEEKKESCQWASIFTGYLSLAIKNTHRTRNL